MKVFVAGATGVLGRRVVASLVAAGHEVTGASRSGANQERLQALGARAAPCDLLDQTSVLRALDGHEAVLHLATKIPDKERTSPHDWEENDRLRREGTRALTAAARIAGCALYVQESVAFLYGDHGDEWIDESTPTHPPLPSTITSAVDMERIVVESGLPSFLLRFGWFYAADAAHTQALLRRARSGSLRVPGDGSTYQSPIHVDDAASAVVAAVSSGTRTAGEILNVCDDEPLRMREYLGHVCERFGRPTPGGAPGFLVRLLLGKGTKDTLFLSQRCRNGRARERLGWVPRFPSIREGFEEVFSRAEDRL